MPFRDQERKLLTSEQRTGEPLPAPTTPYAWCYPPGYGKAAGSFTEKLRHALGAWRRETYGSCVLPISFAYKLYRHRTITVVASRVTLTHQPGWGNGKRGFVIDARVLSIDGIPCRALTGYDMRFAWNRIVARDRMLSLPPPKTPRMAENGLIPVQDGGVSAGEVS